jgi:ABC-type bacteriocin/lantibiotic exporter with double-glycine peptidase domain
MPLSDHEQRILDEIERRLAEEDPRLADQVSRTSLYTHLSRRIKLATVAFLLGFIMLMLFSIATVLALAGFVVMLLSALLVYRYLKRMGKEQLRAAQQAGGRFTFAALIARLSERFRGPAPPPSPPS